MPQNCETIHPPPRMLSKAGSRENKNKTKTKKTKRWRERQDVADLLSIEILFKIKGKPTIRAKNKKATS